LPAPPSSMTSPNFVQTHEPMDVIPDDGAPLLITMISNATYSSILGLLQNSSEAGNILITNGLNPMKAVSGSFRQLAWRVTCDIFLVLWSFTFLFVTVETLIDQRRKWRLAGGCLGYSDPQTWYRVLMCLLCLFSLLELALKNEQGIERSLQSMAWTDLFFYGKLSIIVLALCSIQFSW